MPLFILYTFLIWFSYFMEFYLTFYCFDFSSNLGVMAGLVLFAAGSVAVVVPTPNGAGPWHFAIISMMVLYGVDPTNAGIFALIKHGKMAYQSDCIIRKSGYSKAKSRIIFLKLLPPCPLKIISFLMP